MAKSLSFTVTRRVFYSDAAPGVDVLGVATSRMGAVAYARKLCAKYYAGQVGDEREVGWGTTHIELPNVPGTAGVRFVIEPVPNVSSRTQV